MTVRFPTVRKKKITQHEIEEGPPIVILELPQYPSLQ